MQTHHLTTPDGFPLVAQTSGPLHGPPLLLLAGQTNTHRWWNGLRGRFDDRYRVVTLDQRGTGRSRGPVGEWTSASFADDAAFVLDSLGLGPASVFGTSMGGRVAQMLAVRRPDLVTRLVLGCTSPGGPHATRQPLSVRRRLADPDEDRRRAALEEFFFTPDWAAAQEEITVFGDPTMTPDERRAHLRISNGHDAWDLLASISAPTLVLHGADDPMTSVDAAHQIAALVPGARLQVFPEGRHGFFLEQADVVSRSVLDFLECARLLRTAAVPVSC